MSLRRRGQYRHLASRPDPIDENRRLHYLRCHPPGNNQYPATVTSARRLSPKAQVIAASDNIASAVELYEQGADFVYIARLHSAHDMAELIARAVQDEDGFKDCRENEFRLLKERKEVLQ